MTTFAEQRILDTNAKFNPSEMAQTINYNGRDIQAFIVNGQDSRTLSSISAVTDELTIQVKRSDVLTSTPGTPVTIDGKAWRVKAPVGGNVMSLVIALRSAQAAPIPRRSFPG